MAESARLADMPRPQRQRRAATSKYPPESTYERDVRQALDDWCAAVVSRQAELARRFGIADSAFSRVRRGQQRLHPWWLPAIAARLGRRLMPDLHNPRYWAAADVAQYSGMSHNEAPQPLAPALGSVGAESAPIMEVPGMDKPTDPYTTAIERLIRYVQSLETEAEVTVARRAMEDALYAHHHPLPSGGVAREPRAEGGEP